MLTSKTHHQSSESETVVAVTFDDFFLRDEWSKGLATTSERNSPADQDREVLDLCEKHNIPATLFVPSTVASMFQNEFLDVARGRYEIAGHGFDHEDARNVPLQNQVQLIDNAIEALENACKAPVFGWRTPGLFLNAAIKSAISKSKVHWCSNIRLPSFVRQLPFRYYDNQKVEIPITSLFNDYDGYEKIGLSADKVLRRWLANFNRVHTRHGHEVFTILLHPWVEIKNPKRMKTLEVFLENIRANEDVSFRTCTEIYHRFQTEPTSHFRNCFSKVEAGLTESLISYASKFGVEQHQRKLL